MGRKKEQNRSKRLRQAERRKLTNEYIVLARSRCSTSAGYLALLLDIKGEEPSADQAAYQRWQMIRSALLTAGVTVLWSAFEGKGVRREIVEKFLDSNIEFRRTANELRDERNRRHAHLDMDSEDPQINRIDKVIPPGIRFVGLFYAIPRPSEDEDKIQRYLDLAQRFGEYLRVLLNERYEIA